MRRHLSGILLATFCATLTAGVASAQRVLSVATLAPSGSTWMRGLEAMNRELRRRSNGAVSFRFYPGGVQGDESEVIRKMRAGRLDAGVMTGIGLGQIHRPVLAFMLPGMFANAASLGRARTALAPEVEAAFVAQRMNLVSWGGTGSPRLFSNRAVHSPADLRATRPWVWRDDVVLPAFWAEAGATGVPLALPEVLSALQTHRIDTVVAPPLAALALQWSAQVTHMSEGTNSLSVGGIIVSQAAWGSLPPDQQALTRTVINEFNGLIARNVERDDVAAVRTMTTRGITLVEYTEAERQQWAQLFTRARARLVGVVSDQAWMDRVRAAGR